MQAVAIWQMDKPDMKANSAETVKTIRVCSSANPLFSYKFIKPKCPKFQIGTDYRRVIAALPAPLITSASSSAYNSATLVVEPDTSSVRSSAPILNYLVTNLITHEITQANLDLLNQISIFDLDPLTSYTFQITAVNVDGDSPISLVTNEIRTTAVPAAEPAPPAAQPASVISSQAMLNITSLTTTSKAYPYSQPLLISSSGGSGVGATTFEIASGGSASGCTLSNPTATGTITSTTPGTCLIQAIKAADSNYTAATSATSTFTFTKATPILSNSGIWWIPIVLGKDSDSVPFDLGDPTVADNLAGTFTFVSNTPSVATISGKTVTIVRGGDAAISATFTPTDTTNFNIATITMTLRVTQILHIIES